MLEIRHLTKVYDAKGVAVRALDDVSIRFPERGMVFLLGKSGSGKSTLLNLCGGLDSPDEGEVIIKGRSSKDFSQSDFDSYRNTFIGFVFQEYNILNEFTVEDNIALALELQGKSKNKQQVRDILAQVELEQFAKRKPNTLSGGQKQRVAIARALVKNPEIIMADEPTGALDSNTGKQVLETLKKLSESKLVIVVSHDREFAEVYGDRIIELKDGKVLSDVTKEKVAARREGDNLTFIGEDTIAVQDGSRLTETDMGRIRTFLSKARGKVLLSCGQREIDGFRKAARIDESGAQETFADTDEKAIPSKAYTAEESKFIRSKLPLGKAVRIGASSLRVKPLRLFFTIFLSFIAFTLFGLFSTLTFYNEKSVLLESYIDMGYASVQLEKGYRYDSVEYDRASDKEKSRYTYSEGTYFTPAELRDCADRYGGALGLFNFSTPNDRRTFSINNIENYLSGYYNAELTHFAEGGDSYGALELLTETDLSALADDEVVISSYLFDSLAQCGLLRLAENEYGNIVETNESVSLESYDDIVGEKLYIESSLLTVAGVFRCDLPARFDALKDASAVTDYRLRSELEEELQYGLYRTVLVGDGFYEAYKSDFMGVSRPDYIQYLNGELHATYTAPDFGNIDIYLSEIASLTDASAADGTVFWLDAGKTALVDGEVLLNTNILSDAFNVLTAYVSDHYRPDFDAIYNDAYNAYYEAHWDEVYEEIYAANYDALYQDFLSQGYSEQDAAQNAENEVQNLTENEIVWRAQEEADRAWQEAADAWDAWYNDFLSAREDILYNWYPSQETMDFMRPYIEEGFEQGILPAQIDLIDWSGNAAGSYTVVGFYCAPYCHALFTQADADALLSVYGGPTYFRMETNYTAPADAKYNRILFATPDRAQLSALVNGTETLAEDDSFYTLASPLANMLDNISSTFEVLEQVFLWVGVALALFSMLLLFNFISVSITSKKKEIGILRAVGARSADVFKIFFSESVIITVICFVLSVIASVILCGVVNDLVSSQLQVTLLVFGPLSLLVLIGIAAVTSFIATFLPVYSIAKKKPVDSIRAL